MDHTSVFVTLFGVFMLMSTAFADCPKVYSDIDPDHIRCLDPIGTEVPLSDADINAIVDEHNTIRRNVVLPAANMQKVVWNTELAKSAAIWARTCTLNYPAANLRVEPSLPGIFIAPLVSDRSSVLEALRDDWGKQQSDFKYGQFSPHVVQDYLQLVYDKTSQIGCGVAKCSGTPATIVYCQYAEGVSQSVRQNDKPYEMSYNSCSASPKCDNKLVDCGGKLCFNKGKLDPETCACHCEEHGKYLFTGDLCDKRKCTEKTETCALVFEDDPDKENCKYGNIRDICEVTCLGDVCAEPEE